MFLTFFKLFLLKSSDSLNPQQGPGACTHIGFYLAFQMCAHLRCNRDTNVGDSYVRAEMLNSEVEGHLRNSDLLPDPGGVQAVPHALLHSKHQDLLGEGGVVSAVFRWLDGDMC
jgi:hypothetical protein